MRLKGRTAIVTGAGSGIGRASALLFAIEGAESSIFGLSWERRLAHYLLKISHDPETLLRQASMSNSGD